MTDISAAIARLKEDNIESFEKSGILVVPCNSPEEVIDTVSKVKKIFREIDYHKSWMVDPYYYEKKRHPDGSVVMELGEFS